MVLNVRGLCFTLNEKIYREFDRSSRGISIFSERVRLLHTRAEGAAKNNNLKDAGRIERRTVMLTRLRFP